MLIAFDENKFQTWFKKNKKDVFERYILQNELMHLHDYGRIIYKSELQRELDKGTTNES